MNQIKILMLIDHFGSGGAQRQIVNLAKGLKEQGYYVEFAIYYPQFRHFESEVKQAGIEINELKKSSRFSFSIIYSVCQLIKKKCFNLVISFLDTPNTYAEMASLFTGVKCIVSERSAFPGNKISLSRYIQCTLHTLADRIVVNSKSHQSALIKAFPFLKNKAHIIYNIIGDEFFAIGTNRLVSQNNKVLSVGTINVNKNCLLLIKAIHFIKQKYNIEINVTWAGKVGQSGDDKRFYQECVDFLKHYNLNNQWIWAGETSDIASFYRTHSILVHSSFFEGLPNAICEGMASGLLILASNVNEHPNLLREIYPDLLFDPNDSIELGKKLYNIVNLEKKYKQVLMDRIYERAQTLFNRDMILRRFDEIIRSAVGKKY